MPGMFKNNKESTVVRAEQIRGGVGSIIEKVDNRTRYIRSDIYGYAE